MIRVVLVDDHETVRKGLRLLIDGQGDMQVVGEAADGEAAVAQVMALEPDVAVLDVSMPRMNGLAAARALRDKRASTAVVALTRYADVAYVKALLDAGASGYVLKRSASAQLLSAIRAAARGEQYLDASVTAPRPRLVRGRADGPVLSDREREVLRLMALGYSNKDIAQTLDVAVKTVEVHKSNGMRKLELTGRIDVIKYAVLQGWLVEP